ncbi:unnamed protein product [marine sediment metagenome]|uniref:Uncharacterized protein n=1 Tax=marine sediment metagenome TaxID=412755 RepID=X1ADM5_9ZZZZ
MEPKIQRFCWFDTIPADSTIWKYKRAIEGHKLVVVAVELAVKSIIASDYSAFQVYDGHTYSVWGSFPNIFDQSTLGIFIATEYQLNWSQDLYNWDAKEVTMSARNHHTGVTVQFGMILWFYEVPMTKEETLEYATKQPRYKYRKGFASTLDRYEAP